MRQTAWSEIRNKNSMNKELKEIVGKWAANGQCSKGDNCSFRHDIDKRAKSTQPNPSQRSSTRQSVRNASRTKSPRGRSPRGRMSRLPCKDYLKSTCTTEFCEKWHPPECLFYKYENGCRFEEKCSYVRRQVDEQPCKRSTKNGDKSAVAMLKITRQLGCVFQDMEPPKSSSILRKSSNILKPIRCVRFTKAMVRHADIRDQNPSLGMICPGDPHQRNTNAPKFEDRSQEETEWQERCAREAAWKLAKIVLKLKEKDKTAFFSPSENRCLLAPSTLKPEEREFVVDSGASDAYDKQKGLEWCWNGHFDDVYSYDCHNSQWWSADAWRGHSLCQRIGYILDNESPRGYASSFIARKALRWTRILILIKNGIRIQCNTENFVPIVVPGLSTSSSSSLPTSTPMTPSRKLIIPSIPQARLPHQP